MSFRMRMMTIEGEEMDSGEREGEPLTRTVRIEQRGMIIRRDYVAEYKE